MSTRITKLLRRLTAFTAVTAVAVGLGACDVNEIFDVKNPGRILDEDVSTPRLLGTLVHGASAELSDVMDNRSMDIAIATDEMAGSGSYYSTSVLRQSILRPQDVDAWFEQPQEARWAAEEAIRRFHDIVGQEEARQDTAYTRAYVLGGIGHKFLAENFCEVAYEASPAMGKDTAFQRAYNMFEQAATLAQAQGHDRLLNAARAGMASALVGLAWAGEATWGEAQAMANQVPTDFMYYAYYDENDNWNEVWDETFQRHEMSIFGTVVANEPQDNPRAPWTDCTVPGNCRTELGADGTTDHYRQEKYTGNGADIPVLKGVEARMIEAEYYLIQNDMGNFIDEINAARTHYGLTDLAEPADQQAAWDILDTERMLTLYLEARRMWDLHRWDTDAHDFTMYTGSRLHDFVYGGQIIYETTLDRRQTCVPIPYSECQANPQIDCP